MVEEKPTGVIRRAVPAVAKSPAPAVMTPKDVFRILRRHLLLIIAGTILGLLLGGVSWYVLQNYFPKYTAQTLIEVLPPVETDPMTIITPQVQRDILYGHRLSIANRISQQRTLQNLLARDQIKNTQWYREKGTERKRLKDLRRHFGVYAHRDADYVQISMTWRDAEEAALIVNQMLEMFLAEHGTAEQNEVRDKLNKLEDERARVQRDLDAAERALGEVRTAWGITDLELPQRRYFQHTITLRLNDLELQQNELTLALKQVEADMKNIERWATGPITVQVEYAVEMDPVMTALAQQLAFQEAALSGQLTKFGENHRAVRQIQELIEEIKAKRAARKEEIAEQYRKASFKNAQDQLVVLQERYAELERLIEEAAAKKRDLDLARVQYEERLRIRDERSQMLDTIKAQIEKLRIMLEDPDTPKVRAVGLAPKPLEMVISRQWWVHFPGGTILGFIISLGLAFLVEIANDLVRTPTDVARYLHIPLLGLIPDASEDVQVRRVDLYHAVRQAPYSLTSESYRRCRTNLRLSGSAESLKVLLISSGGAGDGTTSVAVNLATSFVAENKKVLLIDANFRHPNLQSIFPKTETAANLEFGLSNLLMGQCNAQEAIRSSGIEGLDVIEAGPVPSNPAELLGTAKMDELLKEQRKNYDYIIVDTPPVLLVSDAKVLARVVDATVLVFNAAATRRGAAVRTIKEMREVGANIAGCVLFAARALKGGYFHEQFRSYQRYQKAQPVASA